MLKNYIKTAWRNIVHNKTAALINIGGLALGMAVSFMLLLYVYNEWSFDKYHPKSDRLYQVFKNQPFSGEIRTKAFTPQKLAAVLKKDFPEVENVARINEARDFLVAYKNKAIKLNTVAVDPSLLQMFSFDVIYGSDATALNDPSSIILTQSSATAIFGKQNPVGQVVKFANQFPLKVNAVIADNPQNSSFTFKAVIPWAAFIAQAPWLKDENWDNYSYFTYVLLKKGATAATVNGKIANLIGKHYAPDKNIKLFIYPFTRLHLYGDFENGINVGGSIQYVRLFLFLAIGILFIACVNFMNLSTAQSQKRAREVGVRKAIGAGRAGLIAQFLGESLLMAVCALLVATILTIIFFPVFASLVGVDLHIPYTNYWVWFAAVAITIITGLLAGSYPALFLSSFNPVKVLKGQFAGGKKTVLPRQALVVIQFTFAICLIISSAFIYRQIRFIADRPVGYNKNGLIEMPIDGAMFNSFESFRRDAIEAGAITNAAVISEPITNVTGASWNNTWPGQLPGEEKTPIDCFGVTYHFIDTYQLKITEGRDFYKSRPSDSTAVVLNRAAVKLMRLIEPIGKTINWMGANRQVIGVVDDFVWGSPYAPVKPTIIGFMKDWVGNIGLRLNPKASVATSLSSLQSIYKKYNPEYPFDYRFTDESFSHKFHKEKILGTMAVIFTCLAIVISCLGLIGLATFSAEQRRKEISIRKVLGATISNIWIKLSFEFILLVFIAFVIGSAISWYGVNKWLSQYAYHTSLNVWVFILTLATSLLICMFAVSCQAIKAAMVNPVKNLRAE
ncbi:FtsX-like permease family protein [Mucilaginibacter pallidiroseus]|uniref:FtsX-like permease family protein n=1 Tax=Mucilaginibacter pallidiroseus TaxID=2599295 RepID=A0A563UJ44_9SPHI|nr:ABC transporter permease [Mucilaginibacter pallidiroseus]TWR31375.1 FtsX-like permease family protein [Mucilaginibacter pallidiroseus]